MVVIRQSRRRWEDAYRSSATRREDLYADGLCLPGLRPLGEDVAEQLEFVPASFRVIRHMRPRLACSCCDAIVQVPATSRPIEDCIAGAGLLAHSCPR